MRGLVRQSVFLALAAFGSWWLLLGPSPPEEAPPERREVPALSVSLLPFEERPAESEPFAEEQPVDANELPDLPAQELADAFSEEPERPEPPPPELGSPEGQPDPSLAAEVASEPEAAEAEALAELELEAELEPKDAPRADLAPEPEAELPSELASDAADARPAPEQLMRDSELLEAARAEFQADVRQGFATKLFAAPEDQIDIARAFGEELVLIPRAAIDPGTSSPHWYRLEPGPPARVQRVAGRPPLEGYRQYRDLFEYEYARLPRELRELRRAVLSRSEIYLFAALIPLEEWALVVGRRREALAASGRTLEDVRHFVVRYTRAHDVPGAAPVYDVAVEEIVFADGTRFRPGLRTGAARPRSSDPPSSARAIARTP